MSRFVNLLYAMLVDSIWTTEDRAEVIRLLDWPEVAEARAVEEGDRLMRESLAALGINLAPMVAPVAQEGSESSGD